MCCASCCFELFVCFAPVTTLFLLVLLSAPFELYSFATGTPRDWNGLCGLLWFICCGLSGLFALARVGTWLLRGIREITQPMLVICGIVLGLIPVVNMAMSGDSLEALIPVVNMAMSGD